MNVTRREALCRIGATMALPAFGSHASASAPMLFGYQRSSTLLTLLKANGTGAP